MRGMDQSTPGFIPPAIPPKPVTPDASSASNKPQQKPSETNVRETIESILVAFILAFIFRAFVVEAFVIPTGSMAPTLLGAHMRFYCPDCGFKFMVNYSAPGDDPVIPAFNRVEVKVGETPGPGGKPHDVTQVQDRVLHLRCPNCGYKLPERDLVDPDNDATAPPVHYGDRILVLKYLYLFEDPRRWDVVVFKSPDRPEKYDYTQNYIKRLTGRPNEGIVILDGDIYAAPARPDGRYKIEDFRVQRKTDDAQQALWRIVYDNDFYPGRVRGSSSPWVQPWQPAGGVGWRTDAPGSHGGRAFTFDSTDGAGTLRFDPTTIPTADMFPADSVPRSPAFTDWLGYDMTFLQHLSPRQQSQVNQYNLPLHPPSTYVSDVKLAFNYKRASGDGALQATIVKRSDAFVAEVRPDKVRLLHSKIGSGDAPRVVGERAMSIGTKDVRIELQNVDYRVTLFVDGKPVIRTTDYEPETAALLAEFDVRPRVRGPVPSVSISAERQTATVEHLSLWRDIYYLNHVVRWASPDDFPNHVITLGPDEYFVCGDNSLISGDARMWDKPIHLPDDGLDVLDGRVPGRFMLGKAFFVYWPAGYRPMPGLPGLAPNFGDMRFIH
jgi:signal peptidase I